MNLFKNAVTKIEYAESEKELRIISKKDSMEILYVESCDPHGGEPLLWIKGDGPIRSVWLMRGGRVTFYDCNNSALFMIRSLWIWTKEEP